MVVLAYENRGLIKDFTILDEDDNVITPDANDQIRISIGHDGQDAELTVVSGTPTANGSSLTKGASNRMRLDASDLLFAPGVYTLLFDYFDYDDASEWRNICQEVFVLEGTCEY